MLVTLLLQFSVSRCIFLVLHVCMQNSNLARFTGRMHVGFARKWKSLLVLDNKSFVALSIIIYDVPDTLVIGYYLHASRRCALFPKSPLPVKHPPYAKGPISLVTDFMERVYLTVVETSTQSPPRLSTTTSYVPTSASPQLGVPPRRADP
jgi:hypothetical protein